MAQQATVWAAGPYLCDKTFFFTPISGTNDILNEAMKRYRDIIFHQKTTTPPPGNSCNPQYPCNITISLSSLSTVLNGQTSENYTLNVTVFDGSIVADNVFGAIRALETFAQLVDRSSRAPSWYIPMTTVVDAPRFPFRGFLHDTSRHYLSIPVLEKLIDAMSAAKFNVFHWHITDDQSFPYVSTALANLSKGAYGGKSSLTYTPAQVQHIIKFAKYRAVRVIPEFDTPGHTASWGVGYPEFVTPCFKNGKPDGSVGPVNPTTDFVFPFLAQFWKEVAQVFPDDFVHLGGDEVEFDCWRSNPSIQAWMQKRGWTDYALLEQYYEQNLIPIVAATGKKYIVWQEIFDNGLKIDPRTIVDVWKNGDGKSSNTWQQELAAVTKQGFGAILSATWYLNYLGDPYNGDDPVCKQEMYGDWCQYYVVEPLDFDGTDAQKKLVLGGEGCMWGEFSSDSNVETNTWPRAAAVGERLWSAKSNRDLGNFNYRLSLFTCELVRRGIRAEPVTGPGYCDWM